jgi:two-component system, sensor histidine kinase RegB
LKPQLCEGPEPVGRRNPGIIYGLGNLVENAVDFAREAVSITWSWDMDTISLEILDDGEGFPAEILDRIGEPYMSRRSSAVSAGGGLGLGLFIAKTLLERSGGTVRFGNAATPGQGAVVRVNWPRAILDANAANSVPGNPQTLENPALPPK